MKTVILLILISNLASALTFQENLKVLLKNDSSLQQERQYLEYYSSLKKAGYSRFLPSLSFNSVKNSQKYEGAARTESNRNSVDLSVDLFRFGQDYFYLKGNNSAYKAQENKVNSQLLSSEVNLSEQLFRYIELKNDIKIREDIFKLKNQAHAVAKKRYKAGRLSLQDLQKVEIDVNNTKAQIENQLITLANLLSSIANYGDVSTLEIRWPWDDNLAILNQLANKELHLNRHPSYNYERFNSESYQYQKKGLISSLLGSLTLTYSKGETEEFQNNELYEDERVILSFTLPLFNNFNTWSDYKKAVADEYTSRLNFKNTERFLEDSIKNMQTNLKSSIRTYKLRAKTLKLSQRLLEHSLAQFRQGRISVNDLLLDQDRVLQTKLLANAGSAAVHQSTVYLCKALGLSVQNHCF